MRVAWTESASACAGFGIVGTPDPGTDRPSRRTGTAGGCASPLSVRTSSVQLGHRSSGFFDSARPTTARSAIGSADRSGVPLMCCISSARVLAPLNGRAPVSSSWNTIARLYWSENRDTHPSNVSGAAYTGVTPPVTVARTPSSTFASPKSAILTWLNTRNRFWGFTSRCWI